VPGHRWQQNAGAALPDIATELGEHLAGADAALATPAAALELVAWALRRSEALGQVWLSNRAGIRVQFRINIMVWAKVAVRVSCG